ncbi:MAG: BspA family leucine-rich repeat surface protein [Firmicutes bacterium]|nr:BspA family leucine-rich repeat surface protein [Bacillota bacterium]
MEKFKRFAVLFLCSALAASILHIGVLAQEYEQVIYKPEIPYYYSNEKYYDDYNYSEYEEYDVLPMAASVVPLNLVTGVINNSTNAVTPSAGNAAWTFDPAANTVTIHGGPGVYANQQGRGSTSPWQRAGIADDVHRIVFDGPVIGRAFLFGLFNGMPNLTEIENLHYLDTSLVTTMQHMFRHTPSLTRLDLSTFDTYNVQSFNGTFQNTGVTEILGLENWNMSNVTNVSQMFLQARNLQWINTTGWSFDNIATTGVAAGFPQMFEQTDSLHTIIGIETWNVDNLVRTERMFRDALSLQELDLSGWNVSNVTNMIHMFSGARSLRTVNTTGWNTGNVRHMHYMFANSNIDIGTYNTEHALTSIPGIEGWNTANVLTMQNMFNNAFSLPALDLSGWNTGNTERMDSMFRRTNSLTTVGDLSGWDTSSVTLMQNMFRETVFTQLDLSGWDTSSVTNMSEMFRGARDLWRINLGNWDTGGIESPGSMSGMFADTFDLRQITLGAGWTVYGGDNATLLPSVPGNGSWRNVDRDSGGTAWAPLPPDANGLILPDLNNPAVPAGNHDFTSDMFMSNPLAPNEIADTWVWVNRVHYQVTFDFAGGNVNNNTDSIAYNLPAGIPVGADRVPGPVLRQNYMFTGWRYDGQAYGTPNLTPAEAAAHIVTADITFTAQWEAEVTETLTQPNCVIFSLTGGYVGGNQASIMHKITTNDMVGMNRVPVPVRAGWTFEGWRINGQASGTPSLTAAEIASHAVISDIIFVAQWLYNGNTTQPPATQPPAIPPQTIPQQLQPKPVNTPQTAPDSIQWAPRTVETTELLYVVYDEYFRYYQPIELVPDDPTPTASTHYAYMIGFAEDGTIRPQANITRAEVATVFFRLTADEHRANMWSQTNSFADVQRERWFNNAISTMENCGLFAGIPLGGNFYPNQAATRAEFAAMVVNYLGLGHFRFTGGNAFTDTEGHWASDAISAAYLQGWINGFGDGTFGPDELITRAQAATLINRALSRLPENANDLLSGMAMWPDNMNQNAWYFLHIQEATNSHYHVKKEDGIHETWTSLIEPRNWRSLERPYSRPNHIFN